MTINREPAITSTLHLVSKLIALSYLTTASKNINKEKIQHRSDRVRSKKDIGVKKKVETSQQI